MSLYLLMGLAALVVVLVISVWLLGARNLETVQIMQLALIGQVVLMVLSLWNWHLDKTGQQCQKQTLSPQAMRQTVFSGEGFFLDEGFPRVVGEKYQAPFVVPTVLGREVVAQPQHAYLRLVPIYVFQEEELRRYSRQSSSSNKQLYRGLAFMLPNVELRGCALLRSPA